MDNIAADYIGSDPLFPRGGTASFESVWVLCAGWPVVSFTLNFDGTGAPVGTIDLWGCNSRESPVFGVTPGQILIPTTTGIFGTWPNVAGVAGSATVVVKNPLRWHQLRYTRTGGGSAANNFQSLLWNLRSRAG